MAVSLIEVGLSVLEAGDPVQDGELIDTGGKPLTIEYFITEAEAARVAAIAGRWGLPVDLVIHLAVGAGLRWADAPQA